MNSYKLNCIKCNSAYESSDIDPYYCPPCFEQKTAIAKAVDVKLGPPKPQQPKPQLPYREQVIGGVIVRTYTDPATERALGR